MAAVRLAAVFILALAMALGAPSARAEELYTVTKVSVAEGVTTVAVSPDADHVLFALEDGTARIVVAADGKEILSIAWPGSPILWAAFSPDGSSVGLLSQTGAIGLFEVASGHQRLALTPPAPVVALAFSPDGRRLIAALAGGTVRLFDLDTGKELASLGSPSGSDVTSVALSPDGSRAVATSLDKVTVVWDVASGDRLLTLPSDDRLNGAAFSPDGSLIVIAGSDDLAHVVEAASGHEVLTLKGHADDVLDARFSPDGRRIVTGSYDRTARLWDAATGAEIAVLGEHLTEVPRVAFTADGMRVISLARDGRAHIWSRLAAGGLPEDAAGVWRQSFDTDEALPDEVTRFACLNTPIAIGRGGLVVFFETVEDGAPPGATQHLRCQSDLSCRVFAGPPAQGLEATGKVSIEIAGDKANLCAEGGDCLAIERCQAIAWSEAERTSGYAAAWEERVLGAVR